MPHLASRLRKCVIEVRNDVGVHDKQKTESMLGWVDETVAKILLAAKPHGTITVANVFSFYSANNKFLLTSNSQVRMLTAVWIENYTKARALQLKDFCSCPGQV